MRAQGNNVNEIRGALKALFFLYSYESQGEFDMKKTVLRSYAKLIAAKGTNVQKDQEVFTIGTADMSIDAKCRNGKTVAIFRNGNRAF